MHGEEDAEGNLTCTMQTYDNLNRVTMSKRFLITPNDDGGSSSSFSDSDSGSPSSSGFSCSGYDGSGSFHHNTFVLFENNGFNTFDYGGFANFVYEQLLARTENFYDSRGQVWKTEVSVVSPHDGEVQGKLLGQSWYDAAGRVIRQIEPGANQVNEHVYDSLGRVRQSFTKLGDTVFTQSETIFDNLGNAILQTQIKRLSNATGTGALTLTTGRYQSVASWFDGSGRILATANYGTNGGETLARPLVVPDRSDDVLVTETWYDVLTGRAFRTIDPAGKDHRTFFDALGRTVRTVANFTGTGIVSANTPDEK